MTANQRRPGFRLPWTSEEDDPHADGAVAPAAVTTSEGAAVTQVPTNGSAPAVSGAVRETRSSTAETPALEPIAAAEEPKPAAGTTPADTTSAETTAAAATPTTASGGVAPAAADAAASADFMRELVTAMRRVADESRRAGITEIQSRADEHVKRLEVDAERRREELQHRAEADIAGVGEWAKAEAERIKTEAEQRVASRRSQLEQQLAADRDRTEAETKALRDRVGEYERELEAYFAQLAEISDPAAFAAAAKRMPPPPTLPGSPDASPATPAVAEQPAPSPQPAATNAAAAATIAVATASDEIHPAEEEVLAARLADLDTKLDRQPESPKQEAAADSGGEPVTTEVIVKGLGSFGAITGFRQALAGVAGIDGVALSLAQTGDFVFRATHRPGFDLAAAVAELEGEGAKIEPRPQGGLQVTLDRAR